MSEDAAPLVLVPGFLADARVFAPQIAAMSPFCPIHVARPGARDRVAAMADAVLASAPPRFALAGHGLGGLVALELWRSAPERIERLALISTSFLAETPADAAERDVRIARVKAGGLKRILSDEMAPKAGGQGPSRPALVRAVVEMGLAAGAETYEAQSRALQRREDLAPLLDTISVPTLVMGGKADRLCPATRLEVMAARIKGAQLSLIDGAGHYPTLDAEEEATAALLRWLTDALVLA